MTVLISKSQRDSLGIDTLPRAIVWSTLLLLKSVKGTQNPYSNSVRLAANPVTSFIVLDVSIPYNRTTFVNNNGDIISAIVPYGSEDPSVSVNSVEPSDPIYFPIPEDDPRISNLEQYLLWVSMLYKTSIFRFMNNREDVVITFFDERSLNGFPVVQIRASLPYSFPKYVCSGNLIESTFETFIEDPCSDGLLSIGGFVLMFSDNTVLNLGVFV